MSWCEECCRTEGMCNCSNMAKNSCEHYMIIDGEPECGNPFSLCPDFELQCELRDGDE